MMEISSNQNAIDLSKNQNSKNKKEAKVKEKGSFSAVAAGTAAAYLASGPVNILSIKGIQNIAGKLSPEQIKTVNECAEKMIKDSKLAEKGVEIINFADASCADSIPFLNISQVAKGKNAFYNPLTKGIAANQEKLPTVLFHEIGHANNDLNSKFWSIIQKFRGPSILLAGGLMLFGAFSKKAEAEDGKELTKGQKAKNFVRDHIAALTALSMVPVVSEEVMASVRGIKYASKNLTKDLAKKVMKTNIFSAISYICGAAGFALASHIAVKAKDSIMAKQKAKAEQHQKVEVKQHQQVEEVQQQQIEKPAK